jgi:glucokinase
MSGRGGAVSVETGASGAVVAIDLGGTSMKGALVDERGTALARLDVPTPAAQGGAAVLAAVLRLATDLAAAAPVRVVGAAAVTPGQVHQGVVRFAANLGGWRDVPLARELTALLNVPAAVEHDAAGAALAEAQFGPNRSSDCFFVALGTGIGAGHVRDGVVAAGSAGGAGEIGHIPVYPDGDRCACGQIGCLETYASAASIARRYSARSGTVVGGSDDVVVRLGQDPVADAVWQEAVEALALALATTTLLVDPGVVVLGGGLARAGDTLLRPLSARLTARLAWRSPPPIELSVLGTDAGWRGAALLAWAATNVSGPIPATTGVTR